MASLKARIKITHECAGQCWYCYMPKDSEIMSIEMVYKIIEKLKQIYSTGSYKRLKISLTGGDPFSHPHVIFIAKKIKEEFGNNLGYISIDVCSSSNLDTLSKYIELGDGYQCHVGLNEDSIEKMASISKLLKSKGKLGFLNVLLTNKNIDRLDEILGYCISNKILVRFNHVYKSNEIPDLKKRLIPALEKIGNVLVESKFKYYNYLFNCLNLSKERSSYCGYGKDYYVFDVDGSVSRCQIEPPVSHVDDPKLEEKIKYDVSQYLDNCFSCKDFKICKGGCPASRKAYGGYCDEYKTIIPFMRNLKRIQEEINKTR